MGIKCFLLKKYLIDWDDRASKIKIIITVISTIISTMAILLVIGSINGFQHIIKERVHYFYPELGISYYSLPVHDYENKVKVLYGLDFIKLIEPTVYGEFILASFNPDQTPKSLSGCMFRGVKTSENEQAQLDIFEILEKRGFKISKYIGYHPDPSRIPLIIGSELAKKLMLDLGDALNIYIPFFRTTLTGATHKTQGAYLAGIIDTGLFRYNAIAGFMSLGDMQKLLEISSEVYSIDIYLEKDTDIIYAKSEINGLIDGHIRDYSYISGGITGFYNLIKKGLYFVLIIVLAVGLFNIISMIILMILEKLREFSLLNAIGMPLKSIALLVGLKGFIIGTVSSVTGLLLAIIIAGIENKYQLIRIEESIYDIAYLPVYLDPIEVMAIMAVIIFLNTIIPLIPALRILKLDPAHILRYE